MNDNNFGYFNNNNNRHNRRFGNFNNGFSNKPQDEDIAAFIKFLLGMDSISDTSFGTKLEEKHILDLGKSLTAHLPDISVTPVKTEDFTQEIKIAIEDCFEGIVICEGLGSICYILPDKTVFKIQITKL